VDQGGHIRVGLEDHSGGRTPTTLELVQEAVAICNEVGRPVATPSQTIEILGLPARAGAPS
jgi:3-keto-5-aminohexanoate cleavage enzyme